MLYKLEMLNRDCMSKIYYKPEVTEKPCVCHFSLFHLEKEVL